MTITEYKLPGHYRIDWGGGGNPGTLLMSVFPPDPSWFVISLERSMIDNYRIWCPREGPPVWDGAQEFAFAMLEKMILDISKRIFEPQEVQP